MCRAVIPMSCRDTGKHPDATLRELFDGRRQRNWFADNHMGTNFKRSILVIIEVINGILKWLVEIRQAENRKLNTEPIQQR